MTIFLTFASDDYFYWVFKLIGVLFAVIGSLCDKIVGLFILAAKAFFAILVFGANLSCLSRCSFVFWEKMCTQVTWVLTESCGSVFFFSFHCCVNRLQAYLLQIDSVHSKLGKVNYLLISLSGQFFYLFDMALGFVNMKLSKQGVTLTKKAIISLALEVFKHKFFIWLVENSLYELTQFF